MERNLHLLLILRSTSSLLCRLSSYYSSAYLNGFGVKQRRYLLKHIGRRLLPSSSCVSSAALDLHGRLCVFLLAITSPKANYTVLPNDSEELYGKHGLLDREESTLILEATKRT